MCNYNRRQLLELLAHGPSPAIVQNEMHALCQQHDVRTLCAAHRIVFQAYSPLGGPRSRGAVLNHDAVQAIAAARGCSPARVLLQWVASTGAVAIPRASSAGHLADNLAVLSSPSVLLQEDLAALGQLEKNQHFYWNPDQVL